MAEVFVSYKGEDANIARVIVRILRASNLSVWWDGDLQLGKNWKTSVVKEVYGAKVLLGLWTNHAVSSEGVFVPGIGGIPYMESEHERAGIDKVVGLLLNNDAVPFGYESRQFSDLTDWDFRDPDHPEILKLVAHLVELCTPEHSRRTIQSLERRLETAEAELLTLKQNVEESRSGERYIPAQRPVTQPLSTLRLPPGSI